MLSEEVKHLIVRLLTVEKAKVPSLPERNFATLIVGEFPPNKSEVKNSSTAYPVFLR